MAALAAEATAAGIDLRERTAVERIDVVASGAGPPEFAINGARVCVRVHASPRCHTHGDAPRRRCDL